MTLGPRFQQRLEALEANIKSLVLDQSYVCLWKNFHSTWLVWVVVWVWPGSWAWKRKLGRHLLRRFFVGLETILKVSFDPPSILFVTWTAGESSTLSKFHLFGPGTPLYFLILWTLYFLMLWTLYFLIPWNLFLVFSDALDSLFSDTVDSFPCIFWYFGLSWNMD